MFCVSIHVQESWSGFVLVCTRLTPGFVLEQESSWVWFVLLLA